MKLEKFKERNHKQFGIIVFTITCILLVAGVVLYRTFAIFEVKTNQNVIRGNVEDPGNIYFAFYQMDDNHEYKIQKEMPSKDAGYRLDTKTSYCGVNGEKDSNISVSMSDDWIVQVKGMTTSRTKCNLYFKKGENFVNYIQKLPTQEEDSGVSGLYLIDHSGANITWEGTEEQVNNLKHEERRYAGVNYTEGSTDYVHNYVNIDGQVWRVIGLVNTPEGQRIKLMKDESIGEYSWDSSASNVNSGNGVNEWSDSDLMKLLNEGFDVNDLEDSDGNKQLEKYVNNSLYWNGKDGNCYNYFENSHVLCSFTNNKIPEILKSMIETITWNTGSNSSLNQEVPNMNALQFYEMERSSNVGNVCDSSDGRCNDTKKRTVIWKGKVGLIYPSDYGFATIGKSETRESCLGVNISSWASHSDCMYNDWLYTKKSSWMLSPGIYFGQAYRVFSVRYDGYVYADNAGERRTIHPTVYLFSDVLLVTGDGSFDYMFRLSL